MDDVKKYTVYLGHMVHVEMDRPLGSKHPKWGFIYETNYGFVPGTKAGDGHEIDAWVLGEEKPLTQFDGLCIAVVIRKDDDEHKLVVGKTSLTSDQIYNKIAFVERHYDTEILLWELP